MPRKSKEQFLILFRRHNIARAKGNFSHPTDVAWWTNAIAGEFGEALAVYLQICNLSKKMTRGDFNEHTLPNMKLKMAIELADVVTYVDLLLDHLGYNMEDVLRHKFNEVSQRVGYKEKL
jgi:NTP pyrophosphatase (non-canonical NTP hydrolase)